MEMASFRQHCELGMSSVESFNFPKGCTDIIMQHHERLDGSGYPKGLTGNEISLNAKIAMIADIVDDLTSSWPSKQACKMNEAIRIVKSQEGEYPIEIADVLEKVLGCNATMSIDCNPTN